MKLLLKIKLTQNITEEKIKNHGFDWIEYDVENGALYSNGIIKIYPKLNKIIYKSLNQKVLDSVLSLISSGVFEYDKEYDLWEQKI